MNDRNKPSNNPSKRLHTGRELHAWRMRMTLSAKELGQLIGVTERSIHRAEKGGKLGMKVQLAMELLQSRLEHGEIDLPSSLGAALPQGRPPKDEPQTVGEENPRYGSDWHGELRTGADLRRWRISIGLYQKELATLLDVTPHTLRRAEQSNSPSSGLIYGVELLRTKLLSGAYELSDIRKYRVHRGRPKKQE
jgi:transcriptional regulator with XRE-family HTH domain